MTLGIDALECFQATGLRQRIEYVTEQRPGILTRQPGAHQQVGRQSFTKQRRIERQARGPLLLGIERDTVLDIVRGILLGTVLGIVLGVRWCGRWRTKWRTKWRTMWRTMTGPSGIRPLPVVRTGVGAGCTHGFRCESSATSSCSKSASATRSAESTPRRASSTRPLTRAVTWRAASTGMSSGGAHSA